MTMSLVSVEAHRSTNPLPHFVVGQDGDGHWVAVETHGLGGGVFRSRKDAVHYALKETFRRPDAITIAQDAIDFRL